MQNLLTIMAINLAAVAAMMLVGWGISLQRRNVTHVDSLWGVGFVVIAWLTFGLSDGYVGRRWLLALLVTAWGLRLSLYLTRRNWGAGEDRRYGAWRRRAGRNFWLVSLFKVFLLQALFMWVIALVVQVGQASPSPPRLTALDVLGACVWGVGFVFEMAADHQLYVFKRDPANRGRVMDRGLWAYSRHPNYFGEFLMWWGVFVITLATGAWWTVVSPLIISTVLLKMTGIPLTEKSTAETRPGYADYVARTPAFFPWFPRKPAAPRR